MFCFTVVHIYCNFYELKVCALNKSISTILPKACVHPGLQYDILVFSQYFKLSLCNYFCDGDLWVGIFAGASALFWSTRMHLYEMGELNCFGCFDCSTDWLLPHLILLWPDIFWHTRILKLGKLINAQVFKWKKKITCLSFNQKLEVSKFGEEGMKKAG